MNRQIIDILKPQIREKIAEVNAKPNLKREDMKQALKEITEDYMSNLEIALNEVCAEMTGEESDRETV